jgi:hypothetical protein
MFGHNRKISQRLHVGNWWLINLFHTGFVGVFIIRLHTKFKTPSSNGSPVLAFRLKVKYTFHVVVALFYNVQ